MKNNVRDVRDPRRFRRGKKFMSFMLILAMIFAFIVIPATEEEENPVSYHLTIAGTEITAASVEIKTGATLHIFDTDSQGRLSSSTITAKDGAHMQLGSSSNIPEGIQVYDIFHDEESGEDRFVDISGDEEWGWFTFVYDGKENKWIVEPNEPKEPSCDFDRLQSELAQTYFAFGDINDDGVADADDLKYGVMRTLYDGFRVNEGRYQMEGAALGLIEDFNKQVPTNLNANMENTAKVYLINMSASSEQVIIKVKDTYFVRDAYSERGNESEPGNEDDLENFEGLNARALIIVADYDSVEDIVLFGNYAQASEMLSDETSDAYFASGFGTNDGVRYLGDKFVVYKPDFLGVTINGTGETKSPLAWSVESSLSIAETGRNENKNTGTDIYFGFSSVEIAPVTSVDIAGLSVKKIQSAEVLDGIPENAVKIEDTDGDGKYTINFLSDYYDTVRIKVTYGLDNNTTDSGIMTLNRVGIMIQGGMTAGDSHTVNVFHGHEMGETLDVTEYDTYKAKNPDEQHGDYKFAYYATYYYSTSSLATSADVSLFVTCTYADGSVERKLLESDYFTAATSDNVAMSDYILYMGDGSNAPVKVEAIAVPNANEDGTINGAKLGAGKGCSS